MAESGPVEINLMDYLTENFMKTFSRKLPLLFSSCSATRRRTPACHPATTHIIQESWSTGAKIYAKKYRSICMRKR